MLKHLLFTVACLVLLLPLSHGQTRSTFTNGNSILITIEGNDGPYEFTSQDMLVRYNRNTQKIECILNIDNLLPANDSSPYVMAYDLFFAAKYPEFMIEIDAPEDRINAGNLSILTMDRRTRVFFQDAVQEMITSVAFAPDRRALLFSTDFDMNLENFQVLMPAKYLPVLTGRIKVAIRNARWVDMAPK